MCSSDLEGPGEGPQEGEGALEPGVGGLDILRVRGNAITPENREQGPCLGRTGTHDGDVAVYP